jgi:predicted outer membrane protein
MMLLSRAAFMFVFKILVLISCMNKSDKAKVEKQNDERFSSSVDRKEAQFLVDAVDASYGLLEVAHLAEDKITDTSSKERIRKIIDHQTKVSIRLKTFAESNDVSIPFSGPEKTRSRVQNLHDKTGRDFESSWKGQMKKMNDNLKSDLEKFRDKASVPLQQLLDSTVVLIHENQRLIAELDSNNE